jgi:hypothetical protein
MFRVAPIVNAKKACIVFMIHQPIQIIVDAIEIDSGIVQSVIAV